MSETTTRQKLLYGAAGSSVIGIVLVVFFAFGMWIEGTPGSTIFSTRGVQSDVWDPVVASGPIYLPRQGHRHLAAGREPVVSDRPKRPSLVGARLRFSTGCEPAGWPIPRSSYSNPRARRIGTKPGRE